MINIDPKIHDRFSIEFKVGFTGNEGDMVNDFSVNTWLFIPNSLDINAATYGKEIFYRDVKSNVRLITPIYDLATLSDGQSEPLRLLGAALQRWELTGTQSTLASYEFQLRMFAAIFKSALRNAINHLCHLYDPEELSAPCQTCLANISSILAQFRQQKSATRANPVYTFADEYMSHLVDIQASRLLCHIESIRGIESTLREQIVQLVQLERQHKVQSGYSHLSEQDESNNEGLVHRHGLLKKNIESALYLRVDPAPDSRAIQEVSFGIAAGVAMIISTLIALPFQKYLGNYPILIFIILVIAYMCKDRIKDYVRSRFAHQLKAKYFDSKTTIRLLSDKIGWIKEGMDFISDHKTPDRVLHLRNRSALEGNNDILGKRTLLYRKQVHIDNNKLQTLSPYCFKGIHDILRLHIHHFTLKMDDPAVAIHSIGSDGNIHSIKTKRIYFLHVVMQFVHHDQETYRAFQIVTTRDGIEQVIEM